MEPSYSAGKGHFSSHEIQVDKTVYNNVQSTCCAVRMQCPTYPLVFTTQCTVHFYGRGIQRGGEYVPNSLPSLSHQEHVANTTLQATVNVLVQFVVYAPSFFPHCTQS